MAKIYEFPDMGLEDKVQAQDKRILTIGNIVNWTGTAALLSTLGVLGYFAYNKLAHPYELKASDRAKLQHILKPAAIKVGKLALAPGNVESIAQESGPQGIVTVDAEVTAGQAQYQIVADMEKLRGKPDASSTFKVVITREKPVINRPHVIEVENHDPTTHSNGSVWYGNVDLTLTWFKGKGNIPFSQDTHVIDPSDRDSVDWAITNARTEVGFVDEILAGEPAQ
jgi:hypothetical protein